MAFYTFFAFLRIEGATQGLISGGATTEASIGNRYQTGHEDEIMAQEVSHTVTVPVDQQSGQPSGQRVHKPFTFTCSLNKAVPLLYNALTKGERDLPMLKFIGLELQPMEMQNISLQQN